MSRTLTGIITEKFEGNGYYFKIKTKVPLSVIQSLPHSKNELSEDVLTHYTEETHWLADWESLSKDIFEDLEDGAEMEVTFTIKSTSYYASMKHGSQFIGPLRNLNIAKKIEKL